MLLSSSEGQGWWLKSTMKLISNHWNWKGRGRGDSAGSLLAPAPGLPIWELGGTGEPWETFSTPHIGHQGGVGCLRERWRAEESPPNEDAAGAGSMNAKGRGMGVGGGGTKGRPMPSLCG